MTSAQPRGTRAAKAADGRASRWDTHREQRRVELVDATVRAIRRHGAGVGMDEIAAEAHTSKTVIYRHFEDKAGLYRAVAERIDARVVGQVAAALTGNAPSHPRDVIASTVEAYLSLVESDTEVYRFFVHRPLVDRPLADDPVGGTVSHVADELTGLLTAAVGRSPEDLKRARVWARALVGSVQAVADDWLAAGVRQPRAELVALLTDLAWHGLAPALEQGPRP